MRKPRAPGRQIVVGPVAVQRGEEVTECTYMKLKSKRDLAVNRVQIKVSGGSHHVHLYRPQARATALHDLPDGHETCNMALDFEKWQLILASQSILFDWRLPPGIAFHFTAGEQLAAQTHFVDTGLLETPTGKGWAIYNLHAIPKRKVKAYAGVFFGQDRDVYVPPGTSTATTRCEFPRPVNLLAVTGHYHFRGTKFTVATWDGGQPDAPVQVIYDHEGYVDPAFIAHDKEHPLPQVKGIQWTCVYENPTDATYAFGPFTDENEHCNLFMFYYPTLTPQEDMTCVQKNGVAVTTVHAN
jgi:hypothetical protein